MVDKRWEPVQGRYFGIVNVESDDGRPIALFRGEDSAKRELARRQSLPDDDDDRMDEYHHVFPCDIVGAWWNSYDPRPTLPLTPREIASLWEEP